ncbi:hypothetical protein [Sphingobacterium sp.]|uniref:hypothetical protein n=1 Tax=Sphingobacterium sp. TaxID=341027 RepID=UPI00289DCC10|nr:hypothetical protein [Sphingobacterium sp.]
MNTEILAQIIKTQDQQLEEKELLIVTLLIIFLISFLANLVLVMYYANRSKK